MTYWLLKTEPTAYSWDDLVRDKKTMWNGVKNATALQNIRKMAKGDLAFFYHTGTERAVIGTAEINSAPYADPKLGDPKLAVVDLKIGKKLANPVTLAEIKADKFFAGWDFLRLGRLSIVPVPEKFWKKIEEMSAAKK